LILLAKTNAIKIACVGGTLLVAFRLSFLAYNFLCIHSGRTTLVQELRYQKCFVYTFYVW